LTAFQATAIRERRFQDLVIGNYEVLARLGAGGMGTVFKARHRRMKRIVALKVLSPEVARQGSFVQRFQREVETIAQLSHSNIVMAFDADEDKAGHFLVMEFVNGRDLASDVQENGPLSVADAVICLHQASLGLAYAHSQGIVHRDIKPANLLRDTTGLFKVADLGLARINPSEGGTANSSLTQAGGILGTADFMPPEQALDSTSIDHRADVYSLGCTLYFLLAGRPPYVAGSLMALLLQHRDGPIPSLRNSRADVPPELDAIFQRMVAKKPGDRYQSMTEVCQALEMVKGKVSSLDVRPGIPKAQSGKDSAQTDMTVAADSAEQLQQAPPANSPTLAVEAPRPTETRRVSELTVVLIEPSRTQASIVRKYLQQLGILKVHSTGSGQQALTLAKDNGAHALLSTMHLADMTGVQLLQTVQSDAGCANVGFVLMSSEADLSEVGGILSGPRLVLLAKPFDLRKLAQALAQATGRALEDVLPSA
jgi:serine/threonine protein kinase